jgi:hypothetical protein
VGWSQFSSWARCAVSFRVHLEVPSPQSGMASNGRRKRYSGTGTSHKQGVNGEEDFGNQTLPVAQLPDDFDGVPADGSVYLAMVR